ncbi:hypothetical protein CHLRE_16g682700v5 [Chlamydomonas reinhardtii]|uniref:Uncharacterized protein n=1 Tax=Chlamydomonas reinhardtii TaxID=3055 RepID=A8IS43_CHLRE|nr:uncharacterized protein CHLRE_16g682700v5 [Chlamydomonas reinhardtii]PNW72092.1 hypothetical protein CHLRE_16g682700v5 [Chlamydomonas reinhardtii]|eukprot:XP_001691908.1 predicted protein [Chlamydomonas reinhardtii]
MKSSDDGDQVVIPIRHGPSKSAEGSKRMGHKDSILVGLGLILFLSLTWLYFVHRMYLNVAGSSAPSPTPTRVATVSTGTGG